MGNKNASCCVNFNSKNDVKFDTKDIDKPILTEYTNVSSTKLKDNSYITQMLNTDKTYLINNPILSDRIKSIDRVQPEAPKLTIEVINSHSLKEGLILNINSYGIKNSLRKQYDGYVYFGSQNGPDMPINDYIIKSDNSNYSGSTGRHFVIAFNPNNLKYTIKDLGNGNGCFMKIRDDIKLKNNIVINIGDTYIIIKIEENNYINLRFFSCLHELNQLYFFPRLGEIKIGRCHESEVILNDIMLSRIHCSIEFLDNSWYLRDGYTINRGKESLRKLSTNGTWLYLGDEIEIYDKMIFKANLTVFKCHSHD